MNQMQNMRINPSDHVVDKKNTPIESNIRLN